MSTPYNCAFACLACCKSFKREFDLALGLPDDMICPECGGSAYNFGRHFKPPKKSDKNQWEKVRFLFQHGFRFQNIVYEQDGVAVDVPYPKTLREAKDFVERYRAYAIK